jgi:iron-sulfur cluster assembly accessory protein
MTVMTVEAQTQVPPPSIPASPPVVQLTQSAAEQIRTMQQEQPENVGKILRVYVEGGGCSGMQYGMVFDEKRENDHLAEFFGVPVLVDAVSAGYIQGAMICGCGKSFEA